LIGRPPKPTARHLLDGTYRPDRHIAPTGIPATDTPLGEPPASLSTEEQVVWHEVADLASWLRAPDRMALKTYVRLKAMERADLAGMSGAQLAAMNKLGGALGLNPAERARLQVREPEPMSDDEAWFLAANAQ
jgi:hypothetical protein